MKNVISMLGIVALCLFAFTACDSAVGPDEDPPEVVGPQLPQGEAEIIYTFPDISMRPEGIAFDALGNIYVSNRMGVDGDWTNNRVEMINATGAHRVLAELGASGDCGHGWGVLGLTTDTDGNVYAAFGSCTADHGVVKIAPDGSMEHLTGSDQMVFPNSLTMDAQGNLYATDSFGGAVYRYGANNRFEVWSTSELLAPDFEGPVPWGANGIAFAPPNHIYVANTAGSWIAHLPILSNGDAGVAEKIVPTGAESYLFLYPDGLAVDANGMLYAAIPPAGTPPPPGIPDTEFPPFSPVVRLDPATGVVAPMCPPFDVGGEGSELFDTATTLAFGTGRRHHESVFVVSGDMFETPMGSGPVVTQLGVGTAGQW